MPTTTPLTDSALASRIVQGMSLDQKLGQMVIVEFYGATVNGDLTQMIQHNQVSGVLIENKNGNAQSRGQLVSLIQGMQKQAPIPLFTRVASSTSYARLPVSALQNRLLARQEILLWPTTLVIARLPT